MSMSLGIYRASAPIPPKTGWPQVDRLLDYLRSIDVICIGMTISQHTQRTATIDLEFEDNELDICRLYCPDPKFAELAIEAVEKDLERLTEPYGHSDT